ncbi:hypothetical protein [Magnetofaba australis]|uniref:Uncharacterized protein n=1 Tax=Magnetofaba australis IT-1 TaxID=1434232 RepID=A0A1Y2KCJ8_9PROT|nr:hypothetical protein [Magnetofaba australis]OSM08741.1 hypothetical protein MAIT1_04917 [Magnetofaba australis IT-1]
MFNYGVFQNDVVRMALELFESSYSYMCGFTLLDKYPPGTIERMLSKGAFRRGELAMTIIENGAVKMCWFSGNMTTV